MWRQTASARAVLSPRARPPARLFFLQGCTIFVTLHPCNECAKIIIQARISRVIFFSDMYHDTTSTLASKRMFGLAGVEVVRFSSQRSGVTLDFAGMC